jgi:hypothetical protein
MMELIVNDFIPRLRQGAIKNENAPEWNNGDIARLYQRLTLQEATTKSKSHRFVEFPRFPAN